MRSALGLFLLSVHLSTQVIGPVPAISIKLEPFYVSTHSFLGDLEEDRRDNSCAPLSRRDEAFRSRGSSSERLCDRKRAC